MEEIDTLVAAPDWSPDGTQIVCVVEFNPAREFFGDRTIHILNVRDALQGTGDNYLRPLPRVSDSFNDWPAWSPDGTQIAFSAVVGVHRDIFTMNADGTNLRQLTQTENVDEMGPTWSPDGTQIAFQSNLDGNWDIFTMNADGTGHRRLTTNTASDVDPSWGP